MDVDYLCLLVLHDAMQSMRTESVIMMINIAFFYFKVKALLELFHFKFICIA